MILKHHLIATKAGMILLIWVEKNENNEQQKIKNGKNENNEKRKSGVLKEIPNERGAENRNDVVKVHLQPSILKINQSVLLYYHIT